MTARDTDAALADLLDWLHTRSLAGWDIPTLPSAELTVTVNLISFRCAVSLSAFAVFAQVIGHDVAAGVVHCPVLRQEFDLEVRDIAAGRPEGEDETGTDKEGA